ncbi:MAG: hypothetical protein IPG53_01910 [Ignavibacteriales bacterium]|nr:hypothetical protein [Ignavibacteriales bacterium]
MRYLSLLFILLFTSGISQQATEYFPAANGYKWYTKTVVLDSLNQEIDSLAAYTIDSLAGETTYKGYQAQYILGKQVYMKLSPFSHISTHRLFLFQELKQEHILVSAI